MITCPIFKYISQLTMCLQLNPLTSNSRRDNTTSLIPVLRRSSSSENTPTADNMPEHNSEHDEPTAESEKGDRTPFLGLPAPPADVASTWVKDVGLREGFDSVGMWIRYPAGNRVWVRTLKSSVLLVKVCLRLCGLVVVSSTDRLNRCSHCGRSVPKCHFTQLYFL
jgi:hypothetical protein